MITEGTLLELHYHEPRQLSDGRWAGAFRFMYTWGLIWDIDQQGNYEVRWCFRTRGEAVVALRHWDGQADPLGQWIVRKGAPGGDKPGPGAGADAIYHDGRDLGEWSPDLHRRLHR